MRNSRAYEVSETLWSLGNSNKDYDFEMSKAGYGFSWYNLALLLHHPSHANDELTLWLYIGLYKVEAVKLSFIGSM